MRLLNDMKKIEQCLLHCVILNTKSTQKIRRILETSFYLYIDRHYKSVYPDIRILQKQNILLL